MPSNNDIARLVLGTAQLGTAYGIANKKGKPDPEAVADILARAFDAGLRQLDTAAVYGDSEAALGHAGVTDWQIITKIGSLDTLHSDAIQRSLYESVSRSLERLRIDKLHGVMMHAAKDLSGPRGVAVADALMGLRDAGLCDAVGVSIYRPSDLDEIPAAFRPDIVQAPCNLLDQRMIRTGKIAELANIDCAVYARSLFLQGLLLMPSEERPNRFKRWSALLDGCDAALAPDPLAGCLGFVMAQSGISHLVVGVETADQLEEIIAAAARAIVPQGAEQLSSDDTMLIEPRLWAAA